MSRSHPSNGTYRLTPATKYHRPAYDVAVTGAGCNYATPGLVPCPWDEEHQEFRRTDASGWKFGWVCFGDGTYIHFAINPTPYGGNTYIDLDTGTCEEV